MYFFPSRSDVFSKLEKGEGKKFLPPKKDVEVFYLE